MRFPDKPWDLNDPVDLDLAITAYAELVVGVGLGLLPGQDLIITAPLETYPFVQRVTDAAYRAGAGLVTPLYEDDAMMRRRLELAGEDRLDASAAWLWDGVAQANEHGAARLLIWGSDPRLMTGISASRIGRAQRARAAAYRNAQAVISGHKVNWSLVACPTPAWAQLVFPGQSSDMATMRLWQAILRVCRADQPDAASRWRVHNAALLAKTRAVNDMRFEALHFYGAGTDLLVPLARQHIWRGGKTVAANGAHCVPNLPTDEIFTAPDSGGAEGIMRSTRPLALQGQIIDGITLTFAKGEVTAFSAERGQEALASLLSIDAGARRLGEVALVPQDAPVAQASLTFFSTLLDENAACHVALGNAYTNCQHVEASAQALNHSLIHTDIMIGAPDVAVDGLDVESGRTPLMRDGLWCPLD